MSAIGMPPHLLCLFQARPPLEYIEPIKKNKKRKFVGLAEFSHLFETTPPPPVLPFETPKERSQRIKQEKLQKNLIEQKEKIADYCPTDDPKVSGDPFKTLFVARISYETTEKKLKREFENYGSVRRIRLIHDLNGKPRGYAFIEFAHDRHMKESYKKADGKKIDGRRILVDVERARTVPGWLPRRLGGGRGPPRCGVPGKKPQPAPIISSRHTSRYHDSRDRDRRSRSRNRKRSSGRDYERRDRDRDRRR